VLVWFVSLKRKAIDMRELTFGETGFLATLLLFSLGLPLLMSLRNPQDPVRQSSCMKTVWMGQALVALAAVAVLASARFAPYATAFGLVSWAGCAFVLLRQFRVAGIAT
jgi:hypothetical protein